MQQNAKEVEVELTLIGDRLFVKGEHGEHWSYLEHPMQIGLAILQACLGQELCPPRPWKGRKEEEND